MPAFDRPRLERTLRNARLAVEIDPTDASARADLAWAALLLALHTDGGGDAAEPLLLESLRSLRVLETLLHGAAAKRECRRLLALLREVGAPPVIEQAELHHNAILTRLATDLAATDEPLPFHAVIRAAG